MESFLLDTSALVKYYHPETGSQWVLNLVRREQPHLLVSNLTVVEMHSALAKKYRCRAISFQAYQAAVDELVRDMDEGRFAVVELTSHVQTLAINLLKKHAPTRALRTLDALQLAVAMDLKEHGRLGTFVVADETLADVATQEGITAVNPETMGQTEVR